MCLKPIQKLSFFNMRMRLECSQRSISTPEDLLETGGIGKRNGDQTYYRKRTIGRFASHPFEY